MRFSLAVLLAPTIIFSSCLVDAKKPADVVSGKSSGKISSGNGAGNGGGSSGKIIDVNDSIGDSLRNEHKQGNKKPKFNIKSKMKNGGGTFSFDVVEANPAVTPETIVSYLDGHTQPVGDMGYSLLVADPSADGGTIAILSVNTKTDDVQGIVQKKNQKAMKIRQGKGKPSLAEQDAEFVPPVWTCSNSGKQEVHHKKNLFGRALEEGKNHEHHDEENDHHHHHEVQVDFEEIKKSLRGSNIKFGDRRRLQSNNVPYSYQINMVIEIDQAFVNKKNGVEADAFQYVNTLITAANTVYEQEIDTHLHVAVISITNIYDPYNDAGDALDKMVQQYSLGNSWQSAGIDLQHAFIGRSIGGGVAYVGVVCNSDYGYGVSGNLSGGFSDINSEVVWDLSVIMHEIGHQLGSSHTHNADAYSPVVDNCGNSCPSSLPAGSTTLMSYCDMCNGGNANLLYTFGGKYSGSGIKSDIDNWIDSPSLNGDISVNPKRVPFVMWSHVSDQGSCVAVDNTSPPTGQPTPSPTPSPSPKPTVNSSPTPKPTTRPPTSGPVIAIYDNEFGAPVCKNIGSACDTAGLLNGRTGLSGGQEPNGSGSNTIDSCSDGSSGTFHDDESIDRIVVKTSDGSEFKGGKTLIVEATVFAWSDGSSDYADFYYSSSVDNPDWVHIETKRLSFGGLQTLNSQFVLPTGSATQAVRVVFKYSGSGSAASICPGGSYDDVDDVVFAVSLDGMPTTKPTPNPTAKPSSNPTAVPTPKPTAVPTPEPTNSGGNGPQMAMYDSQLGVPACKVSGISCDSGGSLLVGRGGEGPEPNAPNSLDTCKDGNSGTFHDDESIDRVLIKTNDGSSLAPGKTARIEATVFAWADGTDDYADFYYASDASNPNWVFITTKQPTGGGLQTISTQYTLPAGGSSMQAVRVNFRYQGGRSASTTCVDDSYDDVDDIAFKVA